MGTFFFLEKPSVEKCLRIFYGLFVFIREWIQQLQTNKFALRVWVDFLKTAKIVAYQKNTLILRNRYFLHELAAGLRNT